MSRFHDSLSSSQWAMNSSWQSSIFSAFSFCSCRPGQLCLPFGPSSTRKVRDSSFSSGKNSSSLFSRPTTSENTMRVISFSYWLVILRKSFLLMESLRQVRLTAFWMSLRVSASSDSEIYSQTVEAAFPLSGLRCFLGSLRESLSFEDRAKTSWKVLRSGLMRLLLTSFFCLSLAALLGNASVRQRVLMAVLGWKETVEPDRFMFSFCFLPELTLFLTAGLLLKLSFVSSMDYLPFAASPFEDPQPASNALDFFFKNLASSSVLSFFRFSIIEIPIIKRTQHTVQMLRSRKCQKNHIKF